MAKVSATWAVEAGTYAEGELDLTGLSADQVAALIDTELDPDVSVCHQCGDGVIDPQVGELTGFTVDGQHYTRDPEGQWRKWEDSHG